MPEAAIDKDRRWYAGELAGEQCLCENYKSSGYSFCYRCYRELPGEMQKALYRKVGAGYEEAFEAAVKYLEENVW